MSNESGKIPDRPRAGHSARWETRGGVFDFIGIADGAWEIRVDGKRIGTLTQHGDLYDVETHYGAFNAVGTALYYDEVVNLFV